MKPIVFFGIMFRIVLIILIGMATTYFPDMLRDFFGDVRYKDPSGCNSCLFDVHWRWGARHVWYAWGTVLLFILTLINTVIEICQLIDKYYPDKKKDS